MRRLLWNLSVLLPSPAASLFSELTPGKKAALILTGTVVGVTGMWLALYKRGKK